MPTHEDTFTLTLLALAIIIAAAKFGAEIATRYGQAAVLGELIVGVLIGNLHHLGIPSFMWLAHEPSVDTFAQLGVILLLFEVGLESTVAQMLRTGWSSLLVALLGVITPFLLGWGVSTWLLPQASIYTHLFIGATLTATSVGITARVLKDLNQSNSNESRIILGAAVIDDVLGLVILAVVSGMIVAADQGNSISSFYIVTIIGKSLVFLVGSLTLGIWLSPRLFSFASRFRAHGVLLALSLAFCFLLSWGAGIIGLAPIVGAFAAGLILEDVHYRDFTDRGEHGLEELLKPISSFLVPVFFVVMGMRTDLSAFSDLNVMTLAGILVIAAIIGKQICGLGVIGQSASRLTVGLGMIPRGEVGLIFANIGVGLSIQGVPILSNQVFSAIVVVVIVTTMITPPLLKWSLQRSAKK